jgi:hypothetical protein
MRETTFRLIIVCLTLWVLARMTVSALRVWAEIRYYQYQEEEVEVPLWAQL